MSSNCENIEQVILPENMEMEPIAPSEDDVIVVESDADLRTSTDNVNPSTKSTNENTDAVILPERVEREPMAPIGTAASNTAINSSSFIRVLSEVNGQKLADFSKKTAEQMGNFKECIRDVMVYVHDLKAQLNETKGEVNELFGRVDDVEDSTFANDKLRDQASLLYNIVILGVPTFEDENLMKVLLAMAKLKSINVSAQDVREIFRASGDINPPIVVVFNSMSAKLEFLRGKFIFLKDLFKFDSIQDANKKIIIRKALTPHFKEMMDFTCNAVRDGQLEATPFITSNGLLLRFSNEKVISGIISMDELQSIINGLPKPLKSFLKKSSRRRQRCRSTGPRTKQIKKMPSKNKKRGGRRQQFRKTNHGILRTKRFIIVFLFLFFQKNGTSKEKQSKWSSAADLDLDGQEFVTCAKDE